MSLQGKNLHGRERYFRSNFPDLFGDSVVLPELPRNYLLSATFKFLMKAAKTDSATPTRRRCASCGGALAARHIRMRDDGHRPEAHRGEGRRRDDVRDRRRYRGHGRRVSALARAAEASIRACRSRITTICTSTRPPACWGWSPAWRCNGELGQRDDGARHGSALRSVPRLLDRRGHCRRRPCGRVDRLGGVGGDYLVDGDLAHEIDPREMPADWPTGCFCARHAQALRPRRNPRPKVRCFISMAG